MKFVVQKNKDREDIYFVLVKENDKLECHHCKRVFKPADSVIFTNVWDSLFKHQVWLWCHECIQFKNKKYPYLDFCEVNYARLTEIMPINAQTVIFEKPPKFKTSNLSVYDAAYYNKENHANATITDRTKIGPQSWEGASIGLPPEQLENDREINDIDAFLKNAQESTPLLEKKEKSQIEAKP